MKIARNFVGAILNAVAVVASAVLASIAASALLPQAGCPTHAVDFGYPVYQQVRSGVGVRKGLLERRCLPHISSRHFAVHQWPQYDSELVC
jgi:hypothetical protein